MSDKNPAETMERAYEALARGIDSAGQSQEALFFARLSLLLANALDDCAKFESCVQAALQFLPES